MDEDYNPELTRWLDESGHRRAGPTSEAPEELLRYLEALAGTSLRSREDILGHFQRLKAQETERLRVETRQRIRRETVFLALLLVAAAQYSYWDISLQIAALQKVHYFVRAAL